MRTETGARDMRGARIAKSPPSGGYAMSVNDLKRRGLVDFPINLFAVGFFASFDTIASPCSPLFEEKRRTLFFGLLFDRHDPFLFHWSGFHAAFPADNHPIYRKYPYFAIFSVQFSSIARFLLNF